MGILLTESMARAAIERSKLRAALVPALAQPSRWENDGGKVFRRYLQTGNILKVLVSGDKRDVSSVRRLFAAREGEAVVESEARMLRLLSDSEKGSFAGGKASYTLIALHSRDGELIGAANGISWRDIGVVQNVLIAVDERHGGHGYGWLLNSERLLMGFRKMPRPTEVKFQFAELDTNDDSLRKIVRWHGEGVSYALRFPCPFPPLEGESRAISVIPGIFLANCQSNQGIPVKELRDTLGHIHEGFYGTRDYLERFLEVEGLVSLRSLDTEPGRHEAIRFARRQQELFDKIWPRA